MKLVKKIYQTKETEKIIDRGFSETKITIKKLSTSNKAQYRGVPVVAGLGLKVCKKFTSL